VTQPIGDNTLFEPTWDEQYAAAPDRPQPPQITPRNAAEVLAVAKALKSTGLKVAGPATAGAAAGVILSELRRLGYDVVPFPARDVWVRLLDETSHRQVAVFAGGLVRGGWSAVLELPAVADTKSVALRYVLEVKPS
jgi:hypothetical protein